MKKAKFDVFGMTCSACSAHVQKAVEKQEGIKVQVNLLTNSMTAEYDENSITPDSIIRLVQNAGYDASLNSFLDKSGKKIQSPQTNKNMSKENSAAIQKDDLKKRLVLSLLFMLPLFYISMGHMLGLPVPFFMHGIQNAPVFALTQLLLTIPVLTINKKFFTVGFKALLRKAPNMDSLVAVGSAAAVVYGIYALYKMTYAIGQGDMQTVKHFSMDLYFESAAMILTLVTLGKFLESRAKGKTSEAITKLINLRPKTAVIITDAGEKEIPVEEIKKGDVILIKPGSSVPVDGIIIEGNSSVDESAITGESLPVEKTVGSKVISASVNLSGAFKFKAERVGEDTTLSQIIALVEEASASKAPVAKLADKISNYFVPCVILISILSFIVWIISGAEFEFALSRAIAVLVISCPCALGLATPTAIMAGTGKGARLGILIRSAEALETACKTDTVILDKTGTITLGKPEVVSIFKFSSYSEKDILKIAYSLETLSEHPLANAVIKKAEEENCIRLKVKDFKAEHGLGISGIIEDDNLFKGSKIFAGNEKFLLQNGFAIETAISQMDIYAENGATPLLIAEDNISLNKKEILGIIAVADKIKDGSIEAIKEFKNMGIQSVMLTGDNKKTASAIREKIGIDSFAAELLPQDKKNEIEKLNHQGRKTAMIGDGINDAPALMTAHVGIAIGAGTDIALESADIILMHGNLQHAADAIQLSRAVMRNIKENLFWALFYNTLCIPVAAGALYPLFGISLNPMIAAAAMSLSSVSVVGNALRLNRFKPKRLKNILTDTSDIKYENVNSNETDKNKNISEEKIMTTNLIVNGMACEHCKKRVEEALSKISGVKASVNLKEKSVNVEHPESVAVSLLKETITSAGYEVAG